MKNLTKREYFAAMILQGLANTSYHLHSDHATERAVEMADKLIEKLKEKKDGN